MELQACPDVAPAATTPGSSSSEHPTISTNPRDVEIDPRLSPSGAGEGEGTALHDASKAIDVPCSAARHFFFAVLRRVCDRALPAARRPSVLVFSWLSARPAADAARVCVRPGPPVCASALPAAVFAAGVASGLRSVCEAAVDAGFFVCRVVALLLVAAAFFFGSSALVSPPCVQAYPFSHRMSSSESECCRPAIELHAPYRPEIQPLGEWRIEPPEPARALSWKPHSAPRTAHAGARVRQFE